MEWSKLNSSIEETLRIAGRKIYTVSEITDSIKNLIEKNFLSIWVEGEVSNLSVPVSGHAYFTLKDEGSQIRAVMFRQSFDALRFQLEDGMKVLVFGRLSVYKPKGEYQIIVEDLHPKGIGVLQMRFEQLKKRLEAEGLFDPARKRPIPFLPKCIGIVTSIDAAALRDILKILERRYRNLHIIIYSARVQGEGAAEEIAQGIDYLNGLKGIDVLIVGRGGGSLEDLWAFNEEPVARAIYRSRIPVISAVGHEVDFTIADFVADVRAPTPSAAAELVVKSREELLSNINHLQNRFVNASLNYIRLLKHRINILSQGLVDPRKKFFEIRERVDELLERITNGINRSIANMRGLLASRAQHLNSLSPLAVLDRGYSITFLVRTGEVVKSVEQVRMSDDLRVKLMKGELICGIKEIKS